MYVLYICVCIVHLCMYCTFVYVLYICVCIVHLCMYCTFVYVLYIYVCIVHLCMYCTFVYVLYICVCIVHLCMYCREDQDMSRNVFMDVSIKLNVKKVWSLNIAQPISLLIFFGIFMFKSTWLLCAGCS